MLEPMSAAGLSALITSACLALSGFIAVCFKGMSHSRCSKIHACCFNCEREVLTERNPDPLPAPPSESAFAD